jgi:branched-chain amino acid transport system substrate-binding protein
VNSPRPCAAVNRRRRLVRRISAFAALALLTACGGTRLPDSAFSESVQAGGTNAGTGTGSGSGLGGPGSTGSGSGSSSLGGGTGPGGSSTGTGPSGGTGPNGSGNTNPSSNPNSNTGPKSSGQGNTASDRGVTASQITVCNVVTQGGPFGPYQFTPSYYGAAAYFQALNAAGGVHGRSVKFVSHPDDGSDSGNLSQIHTCIDTDKAFAFVANDVYQYGGASYVNSQDVPDIGGAPISTAYYLYPHLYAIYGDHVPRDGKTLGDHGYNYRTDQDALFFKQREHIHHAGVIYYDQSSSQYGANNLAQEFRTGGVKVSTYQVNLGLANYGSAVAQMKADGVDLVADALDLNGNQHLCQAIEQNSGFLSQMKVKLSTVANWTQSLGHDLSSTPGCLAKSWASSTSANFADTSNAQVRAYEAAMHRYFQNDLAHNHQFALEGWAAAAWFTDAVRSCGAKLTRSCVEKYMNRPKPWSGGGLMETPLTGFQPLSAGWYSQAHRECVSAAQWSRQANTWVTRASLNHTCYNARGFKYQLTPPT